MLLSIHSAFGMDSAPGIQSARVRFVVAMQWRVARETGNGHVPRGSARRIQLLRSVGQCFVGSLATICDSDHLRVLIVWVPFSLRERPLSLLRLKLFSATFSTGAPLDVACFFILCLLTVDIRLNSKSSITALVERTNTHMRTWFIALDLSDWIEDSLNFRRSSVIFN